MAKLVEILEEMRKLRKEAESQQKDICREAAKRMQLKEYKRIWEENLLPKRYLVDTDPEFFEKMFLYAAQGISDISVLSEEEFDRRKAFTLDYLKNAEMIKSQI